MGDLTRNFSKKEFACKHCGRVLVDPRLPTALQELRDLANERFPLSTPEERSIKITSGGRCSPWNKKQGGAERSQHIFDVASGRETKASDLKIHGLTIREMYHLALEI